MKSHKYSRTYVEIILDPHEQFPRFNRDGNEFSVRQITYSGGDMVSLRGPSINKKTRLQSLHIERNGDSRIETLPTRHVINLLKAFAGE